MVTGPSFWEMPIAGSVVTGIVAALSAIAVAVFAFYGSQRALTRQLTAQRDSWLRSSLLEATSSYLAAAKGLSDQAFLVGATQVMLLESLGRRQGTRPGLLSESEKGTYLAALVSDQDLRHQIDVLRKRQHKFSGLVFNVRLLLYPHLQVAEQLRKTSDQFFGYTTHPTPDIWDAMVITFSDHCVALRAQLEKQVADLVKQERPIPKGPPASPVAGSENAAEALRKEEDKLAG
jgi:hypothetical protein